MLRILTLAVLLALAAGAATLALGLRRTWGELEEARLRLEEARLRLEAEEARRTDLEVRFLGLKTAHDRVLEKLAELAEEQAAAPRAPAAHPPPAPSPEALSLMDTLNRALREAGWAHHRFFRVRSVEEEGVLAGIQLHVHVPGGGTDAWLAERLRLVLDLEKLELALRFEDGVLLSGGQRLPLPEEGLVLALGRQDAAAMAARLAGWVRITGDLPPLEAVPAAGLHPQDPAFDAGDWIERLDRLFHLARPHERLRVAEVGGLDGEVFRGVVLLGYSRGLLLDRMFQAREMTVEALEGGGVQVRLRGGTLERSGRAIPLRQDGYRVFLPGVEAEDAARILEGRMVR